MPTQKFNKKVSFDLDFQATVINHNERKYSILLLHGWKQNGNYIFEKLKPALPDEATIISPNAPFPVGPFDDSHDWMGYGWYMYSSKKDFYLIPREPSIDYVVKGIEDFPHPKIVIGYSQGGYIAPFIAEKIKSVEHAILINARVISKDLPKKLRYNLISIHGDQDQVVDYDISYKNHMVQTQDQKFGSFYTIKNSNHKINSAILEKLKVCLKNTM